jgi:hypothetical protein
MVQLSATVGSHDVHASPPMPQAFVERALQVGPEQHPVAHVAAQPVHTPLMQLSPVGHISQALPPLPHAPAVLPASHEPFEQQPVGHEVPSHTQAPFRQR